MNLVDCETFFSVRTKSSEICTELALCPQLGWFYHGKLCRKAPERRSVQLLLIFLFLNSLTLTAFNWIVCSSLWSPMESRHRPVNAMTSPLPSALELLPSSNLPWKESRQSHNMTHCCLDWTRSTTLGLGFTHITSQLSTEGHWLPASPW